MTWAIFRDARQLPGVRCKGQIVQLDNKTLLRGKMQLGLYSI